MGAGSVAVVDQQTGGIVRLTTGGVDHNSATLDWGNISTLYVSKRLTFEIRAKASHDDASLEAFISLFDVDWIMFWVQDTTPTYRIYTSSGGATNLESGIAKDTNYHIFRIECLPTGQVHFYIDGVETANSPITTNITALPLQPSIQIINHGGVVRTLDIDYMVVRQEI